MPTASSAAKTPQQAFNRKMARLGVEEAPHAAEVGAAEVREGLPYDALDALSQTLGLTQDVLTHVLGISERTLQRRRRSGRLSASESDRLWRMAHIYHRTLEAFDGQTDEAQAWLTTPKRALGGDTPIGHLDTEPGERMVEQMLATIEYTMPA